MGKVTIGTHHSGLTGTLRRKLVSPKKRGRHWKDTFYPSQAEVHYRAGTTVMIKCLWWKTLLAHIHGITRAFFVLFFVCRCCVFLFFCRWPAVGYTADISENQNCRRFSAAWSRSGQSCLLRPLTRIYTCVISYLPNLHSFFFSKFSLFFVLFCFFLALGVANSGSCVGQQNEISHPGCCYRPLMQVECPPNISIDYKTCVILCQQWIRHLFLWFDKLSYDTY